MKHQFDQIWGFFWLKLLQFSNLNTEVLKKMKHSIMRKGRRRAEPLLSLCSCDVLCLLAPTQAPLNICLLSGSIVSVGDPKKKYTRFEKIGQGWVYICDHKSTLHSYWNRAILGAASLPPGGREGMRLCRPLRWHGGSGTEGSSGWMSERKLRGEEMRSVSWNGRRLIQLSSLLSSSLLLAMY